VTDTNSMEGDKLQFIFIIIAFSLGLLFIALLLSNEAKSEELPTDICGLTVVECPDEDVETIIRNSAKEYGVSEELMIKLAQCESTLNPNAIGDTFMPKPSVGLFQINLHYHPDITREQALDPKFSADWTAKQIKNGKLHLWSCSKKIDF